MAGKNDKGGEQAAKMIGKALKRITVKTVYGAVDLEALLKAKDKTIPLMQVWGVAARGKVATSQYGESIGFLGIFKAVNIGTGEIFRAPKFYAPRGLEEEIAGAMGDVLNAPRQVSFGFTISVSYDPESATKYVYTWDSIANTQESEPMLALEAALAKSGTVKKAALALPAPAK